MIIRRLTEIDEARAREAATFFKGRCPSADAMGQFLVNRSNYLIIAESDGSLAGFVIGYEMPRWDCDSPMMCLYELGVDEPYRRKGIGRALVKKLLECARESGCITMWVLTENNNVPALNLYRSMGGRHDGKTDDICLTYYLSEPKAGSVTSPRS